MLHRLLLALCALAAVACAQRPALPRAGVEPANPAEPHLSNLRQLTDDGDNGEAYFSWDDSQLIWQSNRGGQACDKIWIMNVDGSGKRRVSPDRGAHTCAFFVPGDRRVVFSSTSHLPGNCPPKPAPREGGRYQWPLYPYDIYSAAADGTDLVRLTDNPKYDAEPVVSSDGQRIVFGSQREGDFDIYTMAIDGTDVRRLTDRVGYDGGPWWSPDGSRIVWRAWYPQTEAEHALWRDCMGRDIIVPVPLDLWVMDADGGNKQRLTDNGATNWAPSWHPDGRRLVFSSNQDDWHPDLGRFGHNFELYLIGVDGGGLTRLTNNDLFDSFPMFSHDGRKLVWGANRNSAKPRATDIFIADWVE